MEDSNRRSFLKALVAIPVACRPDTPPRTIPLPVIAPKIDRNSNLRLLNDTYGEFYDDLVMTVSKDNKPMWQIPMSYPV